MCDAMISLQETEVKRILNFFEEVVEWGQEKESRLALSASLALSSSPKGGALGKNGNFAWIAKASLNEKDFPRPGQILPRAGEKSSPQGDKERQDVTQVTKRGAVASRSDDGRSLFNAIRRGYQRWEKKQKPMPCAFWSARRCPTPPTSTLMKRRCRGRCGCGRQHGRRPCLRV